MTSKITKPITVIKVPIQIICKGVNIRYHQNELRYQHRNAG
ncbi:hypothetical protein [Paenibacillus sp. GCM10027629]